MKNKIKGGIGDNVKISDLSHKFKIPISYLKNQLSKGIKVELEHTEDIGIAKEIALDHMSEFPDYYDRLEKMENEAKKSLTIQETIRKILREL